MLLTVLTPKTKYRPVKDLHDTGQPSIVYEVVATRIIEAAKSGERDPEKLRDRALTAFGGKQE